MALDRFTKKNTKQKPTKTTTAMIVGNSRDSNCNNNNIHDDDNDDNHDDDDNQEDNGDDNDNGDDDDSDDDDNRSQLHEWIQTVVCTYCPPLEPSRQERGNVNYCGMFCACLLRHVPIDSGSNNYCPCWQRLQHGFPCQLQSC